MSFLSHILRLALITLVVAGNARAQFARAEGRQILGREGRPLLIKGTSLGNWMVPEGYMWRFGSAANSPHEIEALVALLLGPDKADAFWHTFRDRYVTETDIRFLAATGCNTLRVPFHYKFFVGGEAEGFRLVDRLIGWCRSANIGVILDMHCAPGGQNGTNIDDGSGYPWLYESERAQAQFVDVWRTIARHYADEPVVLGYELLNEPLPNFPSWARFKPLLEPLQRRAAEAIRAVDRRHIIFITGANWDTDFKILGAPFAPNLVYTFHKYWMPPVEGEIRTYLEFRERHNVPLWVGETGENKDPWVAEFRTLLEAHDIGWTFWPYKKMESTAGFVRYRPPVHWEKIVAYAKGPAGTGSEPVKARLELRPSPEEIDASFTELLQLIELARCETNRGYIEALGLKVPAP